MLTPAKIRNHHFDAAGRNAYKAENVDAFFEEVATSYEQVFRENGEMYKKIGLLAERLEEYKKDEDNIRNALIVAQRMAEKITNEAQEKADTLINDATERAQTENARVDAITNDALQKATYQAQAIIEEAQKQAEKMIYDATHESKEAAVSARDKMIKEEATLQMMQVEVTKFKKQILDAYNAQLALIEELPEIVYAQFENEAEEEIVEETPVVEEAAEEPVVEETTVEVAEEVAPEEEKTETFFGGDFSKYVDAADEPKQDDEYVEQLQQMIEETEDTDAEDETDEAEEETLDFEEAGEFVLPKIEESDDEVERLSKEIANGGDIMFTKPKKDEESNGGFNVDMNLIPDNEEDEDEDDNFDDDEGGLGAKLKGFFKK